MSNSHAQDAMIRRHEKELEERSSAAQAIIANAQDAERDLNTAEKETLAGLRTRMGEIQADLAELEKTRDLTEQVHARAKEIDVAISNARRVGSTVVEYRSAGAWMLDLIHAAGGSRDARERLEVYERAAAHQKTGDNPGLVPDPILGPVVNFIDAARPLVSFLGPRAMPSATWYRPKVTARTLVAKQGSAGGAADEKAELASQKMTITRLTGNAVTYGGYVNVSRQNTDFSSPNALDAIINDLAAQYAIETEAATGVLVNAQANLVPVGASPTAATLAAGLWTAAGNIYTALKGQGRLALVVPPARLGLWGQLFAPVNPQNAQSLGFNAGDFSQGVMGAISGIPVIVSAGYPSGVSSHLGSVISSAAVEAYEQRVGVLQAVEPSVLGTQVAYAGYFTPLLIETAGVQRIMAT